MTSNSTEATDSNDENPHKKTEHPPIVPLRQRRLPASFWQQPSIVPTTSPQEILNHSIPLPLTQNVIPNPLHPWLRPSILPPHTIAGVSALAMMQQQQPPTVWMRGPCNCAVCLNSYLQPRFPDVYGGLGFRPACGIGPSCTDPGCKLCSANNGWHPERVGQSRMRSSRYNALME